MSSAAALLNIDPVQAILEQTSLKTTLFDLASRYYNIDTATLEIAGQPPIVYVRRRFVPPASRFQVIQQHTVVAGERPDVVAAQALGDSTLFWRLCDANNVMRPEELTAVPGTQIRITLPEGVTGTAL